MNPCPKLQRNRFLASLSREECERICPHLQVVYLGAGEILCQPDAVSEDVYFPMDCVVSLAHCLEDGSAVSVAMIGNEGVVGIAQFLGGMTMPYTAVNQGRGHAMRIKADILRREFAQGNGFRHRLLLYSQALMTYMGLSSVCNRHHSLSDQIAHLLLQIRDRVLSDEIELTQECIASMLGVRRERVNKAALDLQKEGKIDYSRGRIVLLDRQKLAAQCCGCYAAIRKEFHRLLESGANQPLSCCAAATECP